jgi:molecular chaperone DnaK (HSP70)
MGKIIGIDLGTTNSCVAVMEGDLAVVHFFAFGKCLIPFLCQAQLLHTQTSLPI